MSTATVDQAITEDGVYDLSDDRYHADPVVGGSLSVSGAKKLLPPSCPAVFAYEREHGRPEKRAFDFGHAAHLEVLGVGPELVVCDFDDWRTKDARAARDEAYAGGKVPLLKSEAAAVKAMGDAIRAHPIASVLLNADSAAVEQSLFWFDEEFGIWRRARLDLAARLASGRLIIVDYKSGLSADPAVFSRTAANYGYHMQDAWYLDASRAVGIGDDDTSFLFLIQDKNPPYLVSVVELDDEARRIGRERNRRALEVYRDCETSGIWPGYSADIERVSLPKWAIYQHEETLS